MYSQIKTQLRNQRQTLPFADFSGGLVTALPIQKLKKNELSSCVNFKISTLGGLETRQGLTKYNNTVFPDKVVAMVLASIGATSYEIFACEDKHIYYLDSNDNPVLVSGTLNSTDVQLIGYNDVVVILDGGIIKFWDGTGDLKLAYDDGTGTRGYQFDNSDGDDGGSTSLYNGSTTRLAYKFTSNACDTGWEFDPSEVTATLSKTGSPTGNVLIKLRKESDNSVLATRTMVAATGVTTDAVDYYTIFESSDITTGMTNSISLYCSIEYAGGDAGNCVKVHHTTVASDGHYSSFNGSWTDSAVKDPIFSLKPGIAPKGQFAEARGGRLYVAGDADYTGYVWYSNLTHLDWSTANGGGYISAVDSGANSFAVGGIMALYGDLYVFGKEDQPYLCSLTGTDPSDYALPPLFQRISTTYKTLISTVNNLFFASEAGVNSLRGVEQYGDLRTFCESDAVKDRIDDNWSTNAFSGYNPTDSQYFLKLENCSKLLVCNTKQPDPKTGRLPWQEYRFFKENLSDTDLYSWVESSTTNEFYVTSSSGTDPSIDEPAYVLFDDSEIITETIGSLVNNTWGYGDNDLLNYNTIYIRLADLSTVSGTHISTVLEPTAFGAWGSKTLIAGDDKNVYYLDPSVTDDNEVDVRYLVTTAYFIAPFAKICLCRYHCDILSNVGGQFDVEIFTNNFTVVPTKTNTLAIADSLTVDDLDMLVNDANFSLDIGNRITEHVNLNCQSFMISFRNFIVNGKALYFNNFLMETRKIQR